MNIACLVFDQITLLDAVGPVEVLSRLPGAQTQFVGPVKGPVRSSRSAFTVNADWSLNEVTSPEILLVPGGPGVRALLEDDTVLDWVRQVHESTQWTCSVCTGSLLLASAGLLRGLPATTHWNAMDDLKRYGAHAVNERVVVNGKIVMGAGVSAGIDAALTLASLIAGEDIARAIQLRIEYDPQPPFDAGR
ncbi:MAG: DJ-1/PfpI family protein, partial [Gammaproteobacteria bacterium]|nr:DJ-1/PfpI family protein [Gammaproteobacteria bacterium]